MKSDFMRSVYILSLLLIFTGLMNPLIAAEDSDVVWNGSLKKFFFADRPIQDAEGVIALDAPVRAEDGAVVPIQITAGFPQTTERYIKTVSLVIDRNPSPMAGRFHFSPKSGKADLALRIRVNEYSPVRVIAETNDGKLFMASRFVKATGGCSAPVGTDLDAARKRLGKIRMKTRATGLYEPVQTQLAVSHPNLTGLQKDQVSLLFIPSHFIQKINVTFEGEQIFSAETDISVSENPNFRFYFVPEKAGKMIAEIEDSRGMRFTQSYDYSASKTN